MIYKSAYKITSPFGTRNLNGDTRFHKGVDFVGTDKTIIAPIDGVVQRSTIITDKNNPTWEWGNYIRLDTEDKHLLYFCHLSKRTVKVGQKVKKGDVIGIEGNTGYSFGSHCHFEVRTLNNVSIDPIAYLNFINKTDREKVQRYFDFDNNTMAYLDKHPYTKDLYRKLAKDL